MAVPTDSTQSQVQNARRGHPRAARLPGARPGRPHGDEDGQDTRSVRPSSRSVEEQTAFRTWLRVYAEATDPEVRGQAQAQLAQLMIAGDRLFIRTDHIRDYDERWEVYQETVAHALRTLSWLWERFGAQADLGQYLALCFHTVQARRARRTLLLPLDDEWADPTRDVETHVAHAEYTALLWDLTTALRAFVRDNAAQWSPQAATWFEALYVAGHSEVAIARQARVSREHVHRTVRTILQDPALMAWMTAYFAERLGCALPEVLHALTTQHPRGETPLRPLLQTLFQWRATYEDENHG